MGDFLTDNNPLAKDTFHSFRKENLPTARLNLIVISAQNNYECSDGVFLQRRKQMKKTVSRLGAALI